MYIYVYIYICKDVCVYINKYISPNFKSKPFSIYIYKGIIKKAKGKSNKSAKTTSQNPPKTSKAENSPKPPRIWLSGAVQEWGATTTNKRVLCRTAASWGGDMSVMSSQISRLYHLTSFQKKWSTSVVFAVQKYLGGCWFSSCFKGVMQGKSANPIGSASKTLVLALVFLWKSWQRTAFSVALVRKVCMQKAWPCVSQLESFWLNLFHLHFPTVREQCQHSHPHLVRGHQCARLGCVAHNSKSPVFNAKYGVWIWRHYYYYYSYSSYCCDYYSYSYHYCCCYYRSCFSAFWYACPGASFPLAKR